uniref:Secreted protein n=1 Tax=Ixodes ricinus TaxID=34613 RepID=A0A6B0UTA9_IXORI
MKISACNAGALSFILTLLKTGPSCFLAKLKHTTEETKATIFRCVVTTRKSTNSVAITSEDLCDDVVLTCLALEKVKEWVEDNVAVYSHVTYVSDGAASHFKNRYQLHQFAQNDCPQAQWLFSASGNGKMHATELADS